MKRLVYVAVAVLVALGATLVAARGYLASAVADDGEDVVIPSLGAEVEVWRDSLDVPHVWARSEADLLRALGYLHARDRLWQMELFRRVVDGRMAEALGPDLVETDRFLRTLGMGRLAAENERVLDPESRRLLEAYAEGVNAWLGSRSGALPPEFVALRIEPEPWTVRHSLGVAKLMAWDLADWTVGLDLQRAIDRVGPELGRDLFPTYPAWGDRTLGGEPPAATDPLEAEGVAGVALPHLPETTARLLESVSMARGSNAWVVGGSRTRSGKPILANDPHLAHRAPGLWYLAALHGGDIEVVGVTIPGAPGVVLGHTPAVAWGFTNAMVDDVDFYVEEVHPSDASRYRGPDGWVPFEVREETIRVRGGEPVSHRVRSTRRGPIFSDVDARGGDHVLAMRWTAFEPSTVHRAVLALNRARSAADVLEALRDFNDAHQNVVFADTAGTVGYQLAARVPVRASGDGLLPAPPGQGEWTRYLAYEELPRALNPASGFLINANNPQVGDDYPFRIGSNYLDPHRAMRIREMVESAQRLDAAAVAAQQTDVEDRLARRLLPRALRAAERAGADEAARVLGEWDARADTASRGAALFYVWYELLRQRVGHDEFRGRGVYFPRSALNKVLDAGGGAWVDDVRTPERETLEELEAEAMREAVGVAAGRTWGELHVTEMNHPLGSVALLAEALNLNIGPFPNDGSPYTVDVASYGSSTPPYVNTHGASMRHVADLHDLDGSGGFILPTGQSGLPFSPHYRDQTPLWRAGRLWRIPLARDRAADRTVERMVLRPQ